MSQESDQERVAVRTYVPAYQRDEWDTHAEEMGMSRSEFVRTMVQAGRRGFEEYGPESAGSRPEEGNGESVKAASEAYDPGGDGLETRVLEVLSPDEYLSWDDLVAELTDDVERRLEEALQDLQSAERVVHSPRNGGYALDE